MVAQERDRLLGAVLDRFSESGTEIHDCCPAFSKVRRKFTISVPQFGFLSGFFQSCPEFEKVRLLLKKRDYFWQVGTEIRISALLFEFPSRFLEFRPAF